MLDDEQFDDLVELLDALEQLPAPGDSDPTVIFPPL